MSHFLFRYQCSENQINHIEKQCSDEVSKTMGTNHCSRNGHQMTDFDDRFWFFHPTRAKGAHERESKNHKWNGKEPLIGLAGDYRCSHLPGICCRSLHLSETKRTDDVTGTGYTWHILEWSLSIRGRRRSPGPPSYVGACEIRESFFILSEGVCVPLILVPADPCHLPWSTLLSLMLIPEHASPTWWLRPRISTKYI